MLEKLKVMSEMAKKTWLLTMLLCIGLITYSAQARNFAGTKWTEIKRYMSPPPVMPGPIGIKPGSDPLATVVITADDGQLTWYENLYPKLQKYRLPCTHFIITQKVGGYGYMNWEQIDDVRKWGCDIEAHTRTHRDLDDKLSDIELESEIKGSGDDLKAHFAGNFPDGFAAPEGNYNKRALKEMLKVGYKWHVRGWGGENGEINDMSDGVRNPFELVRFNAEDNHSAKDICEAVKKAEGKPQLLIFMYHFGAKRDNPPKLPFKTMREIRAKVAPELHVFADVFEEAMACIARERDDGRIRLSSISEALAFYTKLATEKRLAQRQEEDEPQLADEPMVRQAQPEPKVASLPPERTTRTSAPMPVQTVFGSPILRTEHAQAVPKNKSPGREALPSVKKMKLVSQARAQALLPAHAPVSPKERRGTSKRVTSAETLW